MCFLDATSVNRSRRLFGRVQGQASTLDVASYARAFDEISAADGACYSAAAFVEWIRLETGSNGASRGAERTGHPSKSGPLANGAASSMPDELRP